MNRKGKDESYHTHIDARHRLLDLKLREVWQYRDLIVLFTKKSFAVTYKQTILGPIWLFLTPLVSSFIYMVVFGQIAGLGTDGIPQMLFYLFGTSVWGFFSTCLTGNAGTFVSNAALFGKVYFPRLTVPVSNVCSAFLRWCIQMSLVVVLLVYYGAHGLVAPHWWGLPLLLLEMLHLGGMGMGLGIVISSLTTKYRDLSVLVGFAVQLWMYATPVVYPLSELPEGSLRTLLLWNPVTMPMEVLRRAVLGTGTVEPGYLAYSWAFAAAVMLAGIMIFNKVERTFMDTV
jgi:lipopolysaccharide transport system permease protein